MSLGALNMISEKSAKSAAAPVSGGFLMTTKPARSP